jgi:hypothetical protein
VTVIATGFGPTRQRRRRPVAESVAPRESGAPRRPRDEGGFEMPPDVLEVPSFLRDP